VTLKSGRPVTRFTKPQRNAKATKHRVYVIPVLQSVDLANPCPTAGRNVPCVGLESIIRVTLAADSATAAPRGARQWQAGVSRG
jgi:hypothetical protein